MGDGALGLEAHPPEEEVPETPQEGAALPEGQGVPEERPAHAHEGQGDEAHHHGVQGVFAPDEPPVEEGQGRGHEEDQGRGDQHPGRVRPVYPLRQGQSR